MTKAEPPTRRLSRFSAVRQVSFRGDRCSAPAGTTPTSGACCGATNGLVCTTACTSTTPDRRVGSNAPGLQCFTPRRRRCVWSRRCSTKARSSTSRLSGTGPHWSNPTEFASITLPTWTSGCCGTWDHRGCATRRPHWMSPAGPQNSMRSPSWRTPASPDGPQHSDCWQYSRADGACLADAGCGRFCSTSQKARVRSSNSATSIAWSGRTGYPEAVVRTGLRRRLVFDTATSSTGNGWW